MSVLRVSRYSECDRDAWDAFVETSLNSVFMHSRRFLDYHPPGRFQDESLCFLDQKNDLVAVLPAARIEDGGTSVLFSHPGATYGGLLFARRRRSRNLDQIVQSLLAYAVESGCSEIRMRLTESVYSETPLEDLHGSLFRHGFEIKAREQSRAIRLSGRSSDELYIALDDTVQRKLRQAEKAGAQTTLASSSDDWAEYWELLRVTLSTRHDTTPTHTIDEISAIRDLLPGRTALVTTRIHDELAAGVVLFFMNATTAHTMYMAMNYDLREHRPLNATLYHAMVESAERGCAWLNLGVSTTPGTNGKELNYGLDEFKQSMGGVATLRDTLVCTL
ncbi:MAG: GNAT family N-acetyltransferase [Planctomycetota bacterium]|jgi:hypothetical protein